MLSEWNDFQRSKEPSMRIAIVTPSLNQARFIGATIESVLGQTRRPDEFVVVDGGSQDGTVRTLEDFSDRLQWWSKTDNGQADAVNKGIEATKGDIIGWINSDDIYYPETLALVEKTFQEHPSADVIYGAADHIGVNGEAIEPYKTESWNFDRLTQRCFICQPAAFFRRSAISRWGALNADLRYCMDYEFWLRLGLNGAKFHYLPFKLAGSRIHPQTKTVADRTKVHEEIIVMLKTRLGKVPARWLYAYGIVTTATWPAAQRNLIVRASAIAAVALSRSFRLNGYPRFDMISAVAKDLPRFLDSRLTQDQGDGSFVRKLLRFTRGRVLRAFSKLGVLKQHSPRPLRLPSSYTTKVDPLATYPVISIVTPSFNQREFIERTITSITNQLYPKLEYIVQDGGSTDGTVEFLRQYGDALRWRSEPDGGQADALNRGFANASGEIMAWLNSDDILLPGALDYVARFFLARPSVDVIYSHRIVIDQNDLEIGRWILPAHDDEVVRWADFIPQETMFWRRRVWDQIGGRVDDSFQFAMDWDLILRFQDAGARFVRVPRFLAAFRFQPNQKTLSRMHDLGAPEISRLLHRCHGRTVDQREIRLRLLPYLVKHVLLRSVHGAGANYV
jgi:glycosyltransferase involved in cell wall biosynthesis